MNSLLRYLPKVRLSAVRFCGQSAESKFPEISVNWNHLLAPENKDHIAENIRRRKGIGDIDLVLKLKGDLDKDPQNDDLKSVRKMS